MFAEQLPAQKGASRSPVMRNTGRENPSLDSANGIPIESRVNEPVIRSWLGTYDK